MPVVAANVVKVLLIVLLYGFLFYVARSMRGHVVGPPVTADMATPRAAVSQPPAAATPTLVIVDESGDTRHHPLTTTVVLGRDTSADIALDDEFASQRHAAFSLEAGSVWVEDLGSTNGTTVNGQEIEGRVAVRPGDTVGVGHTRVTIR